jgi:hypothetical protein
MSSRLNKKFITKRRVAWYRIRNTGGCRSEAKCSAAKNRASKIVSKAKGRAAASNESILNTAGTTGGEAEIERIQGTPETIVINLSSGYCVRVLQNGEWGLKFYQES